MIRDDNFSISFIICFQFFRECLLSPIVLYNGRSFRCINYRRWQLSLRIHYLNAHVVSQAITHSEYSTALFYDHHLLKKETYL